MRAGNTANATGVIGRMCESEQVEKWLPIPGYEGRYEVSNMGEVRGLDRTIFCKNGTRRFQAGKTLKADRTRTGYLQVSLQDSGKTWRQTVHRLVLLAFVGPCPEGMECCHKNGVRDDNRLINLRYDTHSNNQKDQVTHGTNPWAARTECAKGHPLSGDNLVMDNNKRVCRKCRNSRSNAAYRRRCAAPPPQVNVGGKCANGHEYDSGNTYFAPDGGRHCRTCRRDAARRLRERRSAKS